MKDTDGGLVPFDFSLNAKFGKGKTPTWEFCFNNFYCFFQKSHENSFFFRNFSKIVLLIFLHRGKIQMGG